MMDLETQEKISKIMLEQSAKLGIALRALRTVRGLHVEPDDSSMQYATEVAQEALREIAHYGKNPEDL